EEQRSDDVSTDEYRATLHRFLMRHLRNAQDAFDLAQETYVRYYQLPDIEVVLKPRSYLFRVAQNVVYEFRLRRRRELEVLSIDSALFDIEANKAIDPANLDPSHELSNAQLLNRVLMQVPPGYRKVLVMHKRDGLSCAQIAQELGLTRRSVEIYLARAISYARAGMWK
ncbi:RNA polymerase sigma factor, partial [Steroidobacter sp.]|uniref:RNA polymerase sigma factor n=1 Tax=Steroidobacter sp. TaxID=1978227 RepID=UPI001A63DCF7